MVPPLARGEAPMTTTRYYVAMMTAQEAERYTRRIYNIPPEHGIGWTPYRFYILTDAKGE